MTVLLPDEAAPPYSRPQGVAVSVEARPEGQPARRPLAWRTLIYRVPPEPASKRVSVWRDLKRLVMDIAHHVQRVHDLVYDDVELELGGED